MIDLKNKQKETQEKLKLCIAHLSYLFLFNLRKKECNWGHGNANKEKANLFFRPLV